MDAFSVSSSPNVSLDSFFVAQAESSRPRRKLESIPGPVRNKLKSMFNDQRFSDAEDIRQQFSATTLPRSTRPLGVVWPQSHQEVSELMKLLHKHEIPWHAISRGKNWGYGAACAAHDGFMIIDLCRMNRIVEINEDLAYAVIEPGVSQGELANELLERNSRLMLDVTGAGPDASIVGNILQRGFGHTPYGDRAANSCNYQAVLPNGDSISSGFGHITSSNVGNVYPYGQGANVQGMLAQSDSVVVTRMTIWLMPRPDVIEGFAFKTNDDSVFEKVVDQIGKLRQAGTIDSVVHLANDLRAISSQPWMSEYALQAGPFSNDQRQVFRNRGGVSRWNGLGGIYGSAAVVAGKKKDIRKALGRVCGVRFFGQRLVNAIGVIANRIPNLATVNRLKSLSRTVSDVFDLLNGIPTPNHLEGAFFRNRPDSGKVIDAGLIWIAPVIPCTGQDALRLISKIEPIANQFGFDLPITISPVVPRAAVCIGNISYDKSDSQATRSAAECYQAIQDEILRLGYPPYRSQSVKQ